MRGIRPVPVANFTSTSTIQVRTRAGSRSICGGVTKHADQSVKVNRYAVHLDLKYVFAPVTPQFRRRPALRITEENGYFPPVYGFTDGIRFGVSFETNDNTNAREIELH